MQALTREELTKFLRACLEQSEETWLIALLARNHGLRVSELCGRWAVKRVKKQSTRYFHEGILAREVREGSITIRRVKGSAVTKHPLVSDADPLFDEKIATERLALNTGRNQPLFKMDRSTAWRHLQCAGRSAGIRLSACSVRGMKHTLATEVAKKVPVKELQLYLGHKNPKSTMVYYDVTADQAAESVQGVLAR